MSCEIGSFKLLHAEATFSTAAAAAAVVAEEKQRQQKQQWKTGFCFVLSPRILSQLVQVLHNRIFSSLVQGIVAQTTLCGA